MEPKDTRFPGIRQELSLPVDQISDRDLVNHFIEWNYKGRKTPDARSIYQDMLRLESSIDLTPQVATPDSTQIAPADTSLAQVAPQVQQPVTPQFRPAPQLDQARLPEVPERRLTSPEELVEIANQEPDSGFLAFAEENNLTPLQRRSLQVAAALETNRLHREQLEQQVVQQREDQQALRRRIEERPISERVSEAGRSFARGLSRVPVDFFNSIAIAAKRVNEIFPLEEDKPLDEFQTRRLALWLDREANRLFPADEDLQHDFISSVLPEALGQGIAFLGTAALTRRPAPAGSGAIRRLITEGRGAATIGGLVNASQLYEEAIDNYQPTTDAAREIIETTPESDWTPEENRIVQEDRERYETSSFRVYLLGLGIGLTESIPLSNLINRLDKGTGGLLKRSIVEAGKEGSEELVQEFFQTVANNAVAIANFDEDRNILEGAPQGALAGGGAGAILGFATQALFGRRRRDIDALSSREAGRLEDVLTRLGVEDAGEIVTNASDGRPIDQRFPSQEPVQPSQTPQVDPSPASTQVPPLASSGAIEAAPAQERGQTEVPQFDIEQDGSRKRIFLTSEQVGRPNIVQEVEQAVQGSNFTFNFTAPDPITGEDKFYSGSSIDLLQQAVNEVQSVRQANQVVPSPVTDPGPVRRPDPTVQQASPELTEVPSGPDPQGIRSGETAGVAVPVTPGQADAQVSQRPSAARSDAERDNRAPLDPEVQRFIDEGDLSDLEFLRNTLSERDRPIPPQLTERIETLQSQPPQEPVQPSQTPQVDPSPASTQVQQVASSGATEAAPVQTQTVPSKPVTIKPEAGEGEVDFLRRVAAESTDPEQIRESAVLAQSQQDQDFDPIARWFREGNKLQRSSLEEALDRNVVSGINQRQYLSREGKSVDAAVASINELFGQELRNPVTIDDVAAFVRDNQEGLPKLDTLTTELRRKYKEVTGKTLRLPKQKKKVVEPDADDDVPFQRSKKRKKPNVVTPGRRKTIDLVKGQIQSGLDSFTKKQNLPFKVEIVDTAFDLPISILNRYADALNSTITPGVFDADTGKVYLIANDIALASFDSRMSPQAFSVMTYLHEVVAHSGMRGLLGRQFESTMSAIYDSIPKKERRRLIRVYGDQLSNTQRLTNEDKALVADEYLASVAQDLTLAPSLYQQLVNSVENVFRRTFGSKKFVTNNEMVLMLRASADFLRNDRKPVQTLYRQQPNARFLYAGERARTFVDASFTFVGPYDNRERFEISDEEIEIIGEVKEYRNTESGISEVYTGRLDEVISHPELFKAYPEIRSIETVLVKGENEYGGAARVRFDPVSGTYLEDELAIEARGDTDVELLSSLVHELQHIIQVYEVFAQGTSPTFELNKATEKYKQAKRAKEEFEKSRTFRDFTERLAVYQATYKQSSDYIKAKKRDDVLRKKLIKLKVTDPDYPALKKEVHLSSRSIQNILGAEEKWKNLQPEYRRVLRLREEKDNAFDELSSALATNGYSQYERSAGELEAREVQYRLERKMVSLKNNWNAAKKLFDEHERIFTSERVKEIDEAFVQQLESNDFNTDVALANRNATFEYTRMREIADQIEELGFSLGIRDHRDSFKENKPRLAGILGNFEYAIDNAIVRFQRHGNKKPTTKREIALWNVIEQAKEDVWEEGEYDREQMRYAIEELEMKQSAFSVGEYEGINSEEEDALDDFFGEVEFDETESLILDTIRERFDAELQRINNENDTEVAPPFDPIYSDIFDYALHWHGEADDLSLAGFITPDGELVDFSEGSGSRSLDHRNITFPESDLPDGINPNDSGAVMDYFISQGGIRYDSWSGNLDIRKRTTSAQDRIIEEVMERHDGDIYIDLYDNGRRSWIQTEDMTPRRVISQIDQFFEGEDIQNARFQRGKKRLFGVHNLTVEKLRQLSDLGSMVMPSLAIHDPDIQPHENYGDISLVIRPHAIDPEKDPRNYVHSADMWSARIPDQYVKLKKGGLKQIDSDIGPYARKLNRTPASFYPDYNRTSLGWYFSNFENSTELKLKYIEEVLGESYDPPMKRPDMPNGFEFLRSADPAAASKVLRVITRWNNYPRQDKLRGVLGRFVKNVIDASVPSDLDKMTQNVLKRVNEATLGRILEDDGKIKSWKIFELEQGLKRLNAPDEVDTWQAGGQINERIFAHLDDFSTWSRTLIRGWFEEKSYLKNPVNERFIAFTPRNILKQMVAAGVTNGAESGMFGTGQFRAETAYRFKSLEDIRSKSDRLRSYDDVDTMLDEFTRRVEAPRSEIAETYKYPSVSEGLDSTMRALAAFLKGQERTPEAMRRELRKEYFKVDLIADETIDEFISAGEWFEQNALIPYFEAKPMRVVSMSEFEGALVPQEKLAQATELLNGLGVERIVPYSDPSDRVNKLRNEFSNVRFQRSGGYQELSPEMKQAVHSVQLVQDEQGRLLAPNGKPTNLNPLQWKMVRTPQFKNWFGDWENDPSNASKIVDDNGEPQVVYHGTGVEFNVFDKRIAQDREGRKKMLGYGRKKFYFTPERDIAETWANLAESRSSFGVRFDAPRVMEVFLNIRKPVSDVLWYRLFQSEADKHKLVFVTPKMRDKVIASVDSSLKKSGNDGIVSSLAIAAFEPNQIKSAIGSNFDPGSPDIRFQREVPERERLVNRKAPAGHLWFAGMYSRLERFVKTLPNAIPVNIAKRQFAKAPSRGQYRQEEVDFLLRPINVIIDEIVDRGELDPKGRIPREILLREIQIHRPKLEVQFAQLRSNGTLLQVPEQFNLDFFSTQLHPGSTYFFPIHGTDEEVEIYVNSEDSYSVIIDDDDVSEVLVDESEVNDIVRSYQDRKYEERKAEIERQDFEVKYADWALPGKTLNYFETLVIGENAYNSSHWNEATVLHTRTQMRIDNKVDEPIFFIDEIQSDWHQAGRKKGYVDIDTYHRWKELRDESASLMLEERELRENSTQEQRIAFSERVSKNAREFNALQNEIENPNIGSGTIIPAPFSKTWEQVAVRMSIEQAIFNGAKFVALSNGDIQVDRYRLEEPQLMSFYPDRDSVDDSIYPGKLVLSNGQQLEIRSREHFEEVAGVLAANELTSDENYNADEDSFEATLHNLVEEKGLKQFYDSKMRNIFRKEAKQLGAEVIEISLRSDDKTYVVPAFELTEEVAKNFRKGRILFQRIESQRPSAAIPYALRAQTPEEERRPSQQPEHFDESAPVRFQRGRTTNEPPNTRSVYLVDSDFHKAIYDNYFQNGEQVASSRTKPIKDLKLRVGQWMISSHRGIYGHEIAQLRELNPNELQVSEFLVGDNVQGRGDDAIRYADWIRKGLTPPPINVIETVSGNLRVTDGHRRLRAAELTGNPVLAWVWPTMDHPNGDMDQNGNPVQVGMTYEGIHEARFQKFTEAERQRIARLALGEVPGEELLVGTALKKTAIEDVRRLLGLEELPAPERRSFEQAIQEALDQNMVQQVNAISEMIALQPRPLSPVEHAAMVIRMAQLERLRQQAIIRLNEVSQNGPTQEIIDARAALQQIDAEVDRITIASNLAGTATGRALSIRRVSIQLQQEDEVTILKEARARHQRNLSKQDSDEVKALVAELNKAKEQAEEMRQLAMRHQNELARIEADKWLEERKRKARTKKTQTKKDKIRSDRKKALSELRTLGFKVNERLFTGLPYDASLKVAELAWTFVEEGVVTLDDLIQRIIDVAPDLSEQDIIDSISGKNRPSKKTTTDLQRQKREIKKQALLMGKIMDAQNGVLPEKRTRAIPSQEVLKLRRQLDALLRSAYQTERDNEKLRKIQERIGKVQDMLARGYRTPSQRRTPEPGFIQDARNELREIQALMRAEDKLAIINDTLRLIDEGRYVAPPPEPPKQVSIELDKANAQVVIARKKLQQKLRDLEPKFLGERISDALSSFRLIKATADISGILRQGIFFAPRIKTVANSFWTALKVSMSEENTIRLDTALRSMDEHYYRLKYKLFLSEVGDTPTRQEEAFESRFMDHLNKFVRAAIGAGVGTLHSPGVGTVVGTVFGYNFPAIRDFSERNMSTVLNLIRTSVFDHFLRMHMNEDGTLTVDDEVMFALANYINNATGRNTSKKKWVQALNEMNVVFFAPKFSMSRFHTLGSPFIYARTRKEGILDERGKIISAKGSSDLARMVMRDYLAFVSGGLMLAILAALRGAEVNWEDPRDPDWMKITVDKTRIDIWGGLQQPARLLARTVMTGRVLPEEWKEDGLVYTIASQFFSYKLNPGITVPLEFYTGKNVMNQELEPLESVKDALTPLFVNDIPKVYDQFDPVTGTIFSLALAAGVGVNVYDDLEFNSGDMSRLFRTTGYEPRITIPEEFKDKPEGEELERLFQAKVADEARNRGLTSKGAPYTKEKKKELLQEIAREVRAQIHPK